MSGSARSTSWLSSNPIVRVFATARHGAVCIEGALSQVTVRLMVFVFVIVGLGDGEPHQREAMEYYAAAYLPVHQLAQPPCLERGQPLSPDLNDAAGQRRTTEANDLALIACRLAQNPDTVWVVSTWGHRQAPLGCRGNQRRTRDVPSRLRSLAEALEQAEEPRRGAIRAGPAARGSLQRVVRS